MEIRQRVLGQGHPGTLTSMDNLSVTFSRLGQWNKVAVLEVQAMEMRRRVLGEAHPDTLTTMNHLSTTFRCQGRWKEAKELLVEVI